MKIRYGIISNNIDVTEICVSKLLNNNIITIPEGDYNRAQFFTDPVYGAVKNIFIIINDNLTIYEENLTIKINVINKDITTITRESINNKLEDIHSKLHINYGSLYDELPEQNMVVRYLTGNEKVLEIGSNIGRNSLIIASILGENNNNFVTLESDTYIASQLLENRDLNKLNFHIENSALSKRKLIQKGWDTIVSDKLLDGYQNVNTITWDELHLKYNINFDTLVLDCEGAFYYILMDMPEILNNINLIIMENDYHNISEKIYIDEILKKNNFYVDYVERIHNMGWNVCHSNFFEVWKKVCNFTQ
jgi:FkbM family methyltransferase